MKPLLFLLLFISGGARAEDLADLSLATGSGLYSVAASGARTFGIAFDDRLKLGFGARLTNIWLRSGFEVGDSQTIALPATSTAYLNADLHLTFLLSDLLEVGMNIDLIGASFGNEVQSSVGKVAPRGFNLLLGGKNDRGFLNSEFYAGYRMTEHWILRSGLSHQVVEYEMAQDSGNASSNHYQKFYNLFYLSIGYLF